MSTFGEGAYNSTVSSSGKAHMCNCIGCCKSCGHCLTDPAHTDATCLQLQEIAAQRARVFAREAERARLAQAEKDAR